MIRIELVPAENGHVVSISNPDEGVSSLYIASNDDMLKKIISTTVLAYLSDGEEDVSNQTTSSENENTERPNRAARRRK